MSLHANSLFVFFMNFNSVLTDVYCDLQQITWTRQSSRNNVLYLNYILTSYVFTKTLLSQYHFFSQSFYQVNPILLNVSCHQYIIREVFISRSSNNDEGIKGKEKWNKKTNGIRGRITQIFLLRGRREDMPLPTTITVYFIANINLNSKNKLMNKYFKE